MPNPQKFPDVRDWPVLEDSPLASIQDGLFPSGNVQATHSETLQARSESAIAINPKNPKNMIGVSKKFIDPTIYLFRLGVLYTEDGGVSWRESDLPMQPEWDGMTDPTVAFDDFGNAFLVGEPLRFNRDQVRTAKDLTGLGMVVFRSKNGGATWQQPVHLTTDTNDDKQWVVCDNYKTSPHYGNIYVAWGAGSPLRFCRSTDHGDTWIGKGTEPPGTSLISLSFSPELSVSPDGTLHILFHNDGSGEICHLRSTDGGNSFLPVTKPVTGIASLRGHLPATDGWPHFDYGKFRVITLVTDCTVSQSVLLVAWADMREGRSRIYYRRSLDNGVTWTGPMSGEPLLPNVNYGDMHCFHPQIIATSSGVVGCAFYVFGKEYGRWLIRVQLAASWDNGATFPYFITITERSWDPLVGAPFAHGNPNVHFIGEYFGIDAGQDHFALLWTDTRTGMQELFSDIIQTKREIHPHFPSLVGSNLFGVVQDGGGIILVGGKVIPIPPRSPILQVLEALSAAEAAGGLEPVQGSSIKMNALKVARQVLDKEINRITDDHR